ncbi:MAG TPA: hypothetical protein VNW99_01115 [Cytophagaceae bacterium]|nr:hypothetical protein [Cytophagaceae bacterium]
MKLIILSFPDKANLDNSDASLPFYSDQRSSAPHSTLTIMIKCIIDFNSSIWD